MLLLLFGSSAAGKTYALDELRRHGTDLAIHDFDEIGVPPGADRAWRHRGNEAWIGRALDYQADGRDLLLADQTPLDEMLASPSAPRVEAISSCLIDCDDDTRIARLRARGPEWFSRAEAELADYLAWADWLRHHAADPSWEQHVLTEPPTDVAMRWERWIDWRAGDARWSVPTIDTSDAPVDRVAAAILEWTASRTVSFGPGTL
jgi:hypothetical protein